MDEQLIHQVEDLGLSEKEARVYLASLILGPAPVQRLADYSGIKRVTTYVILESLVSLGLASQTFQGKKTFFVAEEPSKLQRLLEKREIELRERKQGFEGLLPELIRLKTMTSSTPRVQYYEGQKAVKEMVRTFLSTHRAKQSGPVYGISNLDNVYHYFPEFDATRNNPDRVKAGLRSKFLYTTSRGPILAATDSASMRESLYLAPERFPFEEDISISGEYVVFVVLSRGAEPLGVTVRSAELANAMKAVFELAWSAGQLDKSASR